MNESLFQDDATSADLLDRYARVVVERGIDTARSEEGFTYRLSRAVAVVSVGERVLVPFGRGNKAAAGIVVELGGPELLGRTVRFLAESGWRATYVDATIMAERPVLGPFMDQMRRGLAASLDAGDDAINLKATTTDGLGLVGRGEGIAAMAVATLEAVK